MRAAALQREVDAPRLHRLGDVRRRPPLRLRPLRRLPRRGGRGDVRQSSGGIFVVHQAASQPPSMESAAPFTAPLPGPAR